MGGSLDRNSRTGFFFLFNSTLIQTGEALLATCYALHLDYPFFLSLTSDFCYDCNSILRDSSVN